MSLGERRARPGLIPPSETDFAALVRSGDHTADGWLLHCADAFFFRGEIETPRRCTPALRVFDRTTRRCWMRRSRRSVRRRQLSQPKTSERGI